MTPLFRNRLRTGIGAAALLVAGIAGGTVVAHSLEPSVEMAPLRPVAIRSLTAGDSVVTVRGRVAEVFGNKFVLDDGSGHALVDTGRKGEDGTLVAAGQPVTVQGRFDRGMMRASFLVDGAGKVQALAPMGPPHGPGGPGRAGPDRGPDGAPDREPGDRRGPPPPPAGAQAPVPVAGGAAPAPVPASAPAQAPTAN